MAFQRKEEVSAGIQVNDRWNGDGQSFILFLQLTTSIIAILSLIFANLTKIDLAVVLLPIAYLAFLLFTGDDNIVFWAPGISMLNIILFARFVFLPFTMCLTGSQSVYILDSSNRAFGVPLMIFELFGIALVLKFTARRTRDVVLVHREKQKINVPFPFLKAGVHYGWMIWILAVAVLVAIAYKNPYLVSGFKLITQGTTGNSSSDLAAGGFIVAVWDTFLAWVYLWVVYIVKKNISHTRLSCIFSILLTYAYLLMIYVGQVNISRWHTVIAFIAGVFCLMLLYPKHRPMVLIWTTIPVAVLIITASAFKNSTYSWAGITYNQALRQLFDVSTFDIYLAGPSTVSDGVTMYLKGVSNISSLFVDLTSNLPFIGHLVNQSLSVAYQYHVALGRSDLIMPLIGQSMVYFGWPFAPVLSMLMVYFVRVFDRLSLTAHDIAHAFIAAFSAAWLGAGVVLNLTIIVSWFGLRIAPFYIFIALIDWLERLSREQNMSSQLERSSKNKPLVSSDFMNLSKSSDSML
jgi:hypothetical protein